MRGRLLTRLYNQYSYGWQCSNAVNFVSANDCFKIITCDPVDDTVGHFESTVAGVANSLAKHNYDTADFKLFYESLLYLMELEEQKYSTTCQLNSEDFETQLLLTVKSVESQSLPAPQSITVESVNSQELSKARPISVSFLSNNKIVSSQDLEGPFFAIMQVLVVLVNDLQAGTMKMREVLGVSSKPSFAEF